ARAADLVHLADRAAPLDFNDAVYLAT
ncbi:MAG: hypothetical protein QOJ89_4393, partial [bacterium]